MMKIEELRAKYGEDRHPPDPECKRCKGVGEINTSFGMRGCLCIYLADRTIREIAAQSIRKVIVEQGDQIKKDAVNFAQYLTQGRRKGGNSA